MRLYSREIEPNEQTADTSNPRLQMHDAERHAAVKLSELAVVS